MTLSLLLPPELELRLREEAKARGLSMEKYAMTVLEGQLPTSSAPHGAIQRLQQWIEEDASLSAEDNERAEEVFRELDLHRLSDRPLFPEDMKGKTW